MIEPHVPPLRRQVVTNHPIEKSLRAVIALQVIAGLGLVGTMVMVRMMQPQDTSSQWRADSHAVEVRNEPSSEPSINSLAPQSPEPVATSTSASPANCGTARVVNTGNPRTVQLRFDNCPHGLQPEPTPTPITADEQPTQPTAPAERYQQQNNSLEP